MDGGLQNWLESDYPLEHGEVTYKHRNLSIDNYSFSKGELQFCEKDFVEKRVSEMKEEFVYNLK